MTGVSAVMDVAGGLDTGDVHAGPRSPVDDRVTNGRAHRKLARRRDLMVGALQGSLDAGRPQPTTGSHLRPQDRRGPTSGLDTAGGRRGADRPASVGRGRPSAVSGSRSSPPNRSTWTSSRTVQGDRRHRRGVRSGHGLRLSVVNPGRAAMDAGVVNETTGRRVVQRLTRPATCPAAARRTAEIASVEIVSGSSECFRGAGSHRRRRCLRQPGAQRGARPQRARPLIECEFLTVWSTARCVIVRRAG